MPGWIVTRSAQPRGLGVQALSLLTGERVEFLATPTGPRYEAPYKQQRVMSPRSLLQLIKLGARAS